MNYRYSLNKKYIFNLLITIYNGDGEGSAIPVLIPDRVGWTGFPDQSRPIPMPISDLGNLIQNNIHKDQL